ncbi:hypothetical protein [Cohnella sp. GCM10027633]|uniref:hypothetical protein n=1 Tax=unclassified Cohnella TaxID=2636738 RepID=UPI00362D50F9
MKKQNPYALAILGLMLVIFGAIDTIFIANKIIGIVLMTAGFVTGYIGLEHAKKLKAAAAQAKKK